MAWWLQAQRTAISMAPAVFAVVSESVSSAQADKQAHDEANSSMDANAHSDRNTEDAHAGNADSELLLQRGLDCAAAWFKLGVLLTIPGSAYECAAPPAQ